MWIIVLFIKMLIRLSRKATRNIAQNIEKEWNENKNATLEKYRFKMKEDNREVEKWRQKMHPQ